MPNTGENGEIAGRLNAEEAEVIQAVEETSVEN
jgi:hypothetical protein